VGRIIADLIPTKQWFQRYKGLTRSIQVYLNYRFISAVMDASYIAIANAPTFVESQYSDYWKWIFTVFPQYKPSPGRLTDALVFNMGEDIKIDGYKGFTVGLGNINRLDRVTAINSDMMWVGGKGSNKPKHVSTLSVVPERHGYWFPMEFGISEKVAPKHFLMAGKTALQNFWSSYIPTALKAIARDWNGNTVEGGMQKIGIYEVRTLGEETFMTSMYPPGSGYNAKTGEIAGWQGGANYQAYHRTITMMNETNALLVAYGHYLIGR
jgi:hypothetical protein